MDIKTHLLIAENLNNDHSDPHAIGVITVPWEQIGESDLLKEIHDAMTPEDRQACAREGQLMLTIDYGFTEEYKDGVGLVMRDVDIKVDKLKAEEKAAIGGWIQEQYGAAAGSDAELAAALANPAVKEHIVADMTIAGMGKKAFLEALEGHRHGEEPPYPMEEQDIQRIAASLAARGADAEKHYDTVAMDMRERWPSAQESNYGHDAKGEAQVIFFKGFDAAAETIVKSGPYAKLPAWPSYDEGFDHFDESGIARDAEDARLAPGSIRPDADYSYYPDRIISAEFNGKEALDIIQGWRDTQESSPTYNGMDRNCVGVAGTVAFGDKYGQLVESLTGKDCSQGTPKLKNADLRAGLEADNLLPLGMAAAWIDGITPETVTPEDSQGIGKAVKHAEEKFEMHQSMNTARIAIAQKGIGLRDHGATFGAGDGIRPGAEHNGTEKEQRGIS